MNCKILSPYNKHSKYSFGRFTVDGYIPYPKHDDYIYQDIDLFLHRYFVVHGGEDIGFYTLRGAKKYLDKLYKQRGYILCDDWEEFERYKLLL